MKLHLEILDEARKEIFNRLKTFKRIGYLAGGTALALQLGHRVSYDFDIFCAKPLAASFFLKAKMALQVKNILINNSDEFTCITNDGVKVSFIYYPFNLKSYLIKTEFSLNILNPEGVALAKAYALNRRNSWRDYLDLYFILRSGKTDLPKIIKAAEKIYQEAFSSKLFLSQLLYTKDIAPAEIKQVEFLGEKAGLKKVEDYFKNKVNF